MRKDGATASSRLRPLRHGFLALLMLSALVVIGPSVQEVVRIILERQLGAILQRDVSLGSIRTNLLTRTINIHDLRITSAAPPGDSLFVGHVRIVYSLRKLLDRVLQVDHILVEDIDLFAVRTATGELKVPVLPPQDGDGAPQGARDTTGANWKAQIDSATIEDLSVIYEDRALPGSIRLSQTGAAARFLRMDSVKVRLSSAEGNVRIPWYAGDIASMVAEGTVTPQWLELDQTRIVAAQSRIKARGTIPFSPEGTWDLSATADTEVEPLLIVREALPQLEPQGRAVLEASFEGTLRNPLLAAEATLSNLRYADFPADTIDLAASYGPADTLSVEASIRSVLGSGSITSYTRIPQLLTSPSIVSYTIQADFDSLAVGQIVKAAGQQQLDIPRTSAALSLQARGKSLEQLPQTAMLDATINTVVPGTAETKKVDLAVALSKPDWSVTAALGPENTLSGSGIITDEFDVEGSLSLQLARPAYISTFFLEEPVRGQLDASAELGGGFTDPRIVFTVDSDSLHWSGLTVGSLTAVGVYTTDTLYLSRSSLQAQANLQRLLPELGVEDVSGRAYVDAQAHGTLDNPVAQANLRLEDPGYGDFSVSRLTVAASYDSDSLTWERLHIVKSATTVLGSGTVGLEPQGQTVRAQFAVRSQGQRSGTIRLTGTLGDTLTAMIRVDELESSSLVPWVPQLEDVDAALSLNADIEGLVEAPEGRLRFLVEHELTPDTAATYKGTVTVRDRRVRADAVALFGGALDSLLFTARAPLQWGPPWTIEHLIGEGAIVEVRGDSIPYGMVFDLAYPALDASGMMSLELRMRKVQTVWSLSGEMRATASTAVYAPQSIAAYGVDIAAVADGTLRAPELRMSISGDSVSYRDTRLETLQARVRLLERELVVDTLSVRVDPRGSIAVSGALPLDMGGDPQEVWRGLRIRFGLEEIPLPIANSFLEQQIITEGTVSGRGWVRGRTEGFSSDGSLRIDGLRVALPGCEPDVGPVDARMSLQDDQIMLERLRADWSDGSVRADGRIRLSHRGIENVRLTAKVREVRLRCGPEIDAGIARADLTLIDTLDHYLLRGDIGLAETRYTQTVDLTQLAERAVRGGGPQPPGASPSMLEKLRLRIRVRLSRNLMVDSDIGRALLNGALTLSGPATSPSITGQISVVEGHVYYLDRKFEIRRGRLGFFDPYELNPQINLVAVSEVFAFSPGGDQRRYMVTLRVGGTLQDPTITLTSEPELSPPQIVSLLTLGTTQPGIGEDITERAQELLTQQLAGFGTRKLERLLNVEDITITGNIFDLQGPTGPRLAITKRITSRLALTYQTVIGDLNVQRALVSFRLFQFLFLEGETTTQGQGGIDLRFRKSW